MKPVWVVDDDRSVRFVLATALSEAGYDVSGFDSAQAVRDALAKRPPPDMLFTDTRLLQGMARQFVQTGYLLVMGQGVECSHGRASNRAERVIQGADEQVGVLAAEHQRRTQFENVVAGADLAD